MDTSFILYETAVNNNDYTNLENKVAKLKRKQKKNCL